MVPLALLAAIISLALSASPVRPAAAREDIAVVATVSSSNPDPGCALTISVVVTNDGRGIPGVRLSATETDEVADTGPDGVASIPYDFSRYGPGREAVVGVAADVYGRNYSEVVRFTPIEGGACEKPASFALSGPMPTTAPIRPLPPFGIPDGVGNTGGGGMAAVSGRPLIGIGVMLAVLSAAAWGGTRWSRPR